VAPEIEFGRDTGALKVKVNTVPAGMVCVVVVKFSNNKSCEFVWVGQERVALRPKDKVAQNAEGTISAARQQARFSRLAIT
jgi:hypothetical protein